MPRIHIRRYSADEFDYGQPFARSVAAAGEVIGRGISERERLRSEEERARGEQSSREADLAAALDEYGRKSKAAEQREVGETLSEAQQMGGLLGPFGALNPAVLGKAAMSAQQIQEETAADVEFVRSQGMSVPAARHWLGERAKERKEKYRAEGFADEARAVQEALADGELEPPEAIFGGGGKPAQQSDAGEQQAQELSKTLQGMMKSGAQPGAIQKILSKRYELNRRLRMRSQAWAQADQDAIAFLGTLEQGLSGVQDQSIREKLVPKIALAKGEWARTEHPSFRMKTDPAESIGALQRIVFSAQGQAGGPIGQTGTELEHMEQQVAGGAFTPERAQAAGGVDVSGYRPPSRVAPQTSQNAPGARQAPGRPATRPGKRSETEQLRSVVLDGAMEALKGGTPEERAEAMGRLRLRIADDLGLDPNSPAVRAAVRQALSEAFQGR